MLAESLNEINKAITVIFGLQQEQSQIYLYALLIIFIIAWLTLSGYMLSKEPHLLEKWKYPTMGSISVIILTGISSFLVAFLFVTLVMYISAFEDKKISFPPFIMTLIFMVMYIVIALEKGKSIGSVKKTEYLPKKLGTFVPQSFGLVVSLFFWNLSLYFIHDVMNTGLVKSIGLISPFRKWMGAVMLAIIGIMFFVINYHPNKVKEINDRLTKQFVGFLKIKKRKTDSPKTQ